MFMKNHYLNQVSKMVKKFCKRMNLRLKVLFLISIVQQRNMISSRQMMGSHFLKWNVVYSLQRIYLKILNHTMKIFNKDNFLPIIQIQ